MTERLYRVRPLVWIQLRNIDHWFAKTFGTGQYVVSAASIVSGHWSIRVPQGTIINCDSLEHGKQLCQEHWEKELGRFLELAHESDGKCQECHTAEATIHQVQGVPVLAFCQPCAERLGYDAECDVGN